jgi:hypothetical protein
MVTANCTHNYIVVDGTPTTMNGIVGIYDSKEKAIDAIEVISFPNLGTFQEIENTFHKVVAWKAFYDRGKLLTILRVEVNKTYNNKQKL